MVAPVSDSIIWTPNPPGPDGISKQEFALSRPEKEILYGGARGGGKSECGRAWLLKWVHLPYFRALVLRLQADDLKEWCVKANTLYSRLGARMIGRPPMFKFPSGAIIWTGHLQDESAYQKYQGWELHKIVIEELTQIPTEQRYELLLGSLRSTQSEIETQAFLTTNPGGPGNDWVQNRFMLCSDFKGRPAQSMKPILLDAKGLRSRIFIPATVDDNPRLYEVDPGYLEYLDSLDPNMRKAWRFGDWNAFKGQYFSEFRKERKLGEPEEALHVINPVELPRYCPRWIGWDWGYSHESAVYWGCANEDGRVHIYREIYRKGLGAEEFGALVAEESLDDIAGLPDRHMTIFLSPDAFARRDARNTIAEQIQEGIRMVVGEKAVFLVDLNEDERGLDPSDAYDSLERRRNAQKGSTMITIERANNDRLGGWMFVHQMLRWWPIKTTDANRQPDEQMVRAILRMPDSNRKYAEYMAQFTTTGGEILPKLVIHSNVAELPKGMLRVRHDDKRPEDVKKEDGDDPADALRYLLMGYRKQNIEVPKDVFISRALQERTPKYGYLSPQAKVMMARVAEAEFKKSSSFSGWLRVPRNAA